MPIPETWALKKRSEKITSQGWEINQLWRGKAGANGANITTLIANFVGWSGININRPNPADDGDGDAEVEILFAANSSGAIRPITDPEYGLIKRTWTRHSNMIQRPIIDHPRANELVPFDREWPGRLVIAAAHYNEKYKEWLQAYLSGTEGIEKPDAEKFYYAVSPGGNTSSETSAWLFNEMAEDPSASFDFNQYVLRKTEVVTSDTVLRASDTNVDRLFSYLTLTTDATYGEPTLPSHALLDSAGLETWIWLKGAPEIEAVAGGNFQIVQEYWGFPLLTDSLTQRHGAVL